MAYGLLSYNINGVVQIDDTSLQLEVKKTGTATCGRLSNTTADAVSIAQRDGNGTGAICAIVPLVDNRDKCFVYAKPSKRSPQSQNLCFGMLYGTVEINMNALGAPSVGSNVINVGYNVTAAAGVTVLNL